MAKKKKKSSKLKVNPLKYSAEFEEFYSAYPRKVQKLKAAEKYQKFVNMGVEHAKIVEGARKYSVYIRYSAIEERFVKHPATWLNGGCWDDEYPIGDARQAPVGKTAYGDSVKRAAETVADYYRDEENLRPERMH